MYGLCLWLMELSGFHTCLLNSTLISYITVIHSIIPSGFRPDPPHTNQPTVLGAVPEDSAATAGVAAKQP
jgi:hypothetical protein